MEIDLLEFRIRAQRFSGQSPSEETAVSASWKIGIIQGIPDCPQLNIANVKIKSVGLLAAGLTVKALNDLLKYYKKVEEINSGEYKKAIKSPIVKLAPLPTSAQFLNVIESIFSGMARAIIHNSDYQSVEECQAAINRYFLERNDKFQKHPKRAGNKIWGKERVKAVFSEANCRKDPKYC